MPFTIHSDPALPRVINIRHGKTDVVEMPPIGTSNQGRKRMSEEKKLGKETGVKKISQEPADKQGPIGTSEKPEQPASGEDVNLGEQEDKSNG